MNKRLRHFLTFRLQDESEAKIKGLQDESQGLRETSTSLQEKLRSLEKASQASHSTSKDLQSQLHTIRYDDTRPRSLKLEREKLPFHAFRCFTR